MMMADIEDLDLDGIDTADSAVLDALLEEAAQARRCGDLDSALDAVRRVLDIVPDHTESLLAAAEISRLRGQPKEALLYCLDLTLRCSPPCPPPARPPSPGRAPSTWDACPLSWASLA